MIASVARGHAPGLVCLVRDPVAEDELVRGLADRLLALSPTVDLGGAPRGQHHALFVEVPTGKRGAAFGARLVELCQGLGLHVRIGIADDRFTATVAASVERAHDGAVVCVPRGGAAAFLAPQPLALLALPPEIQHMLECLGVRTLGDFAALPPPSVARSWDADLQALARGDGGARLDPYQPAPVVRERVVVTDGIGAAIQALASRLTERLAGRAGHRVRIELGLPDRAVLHFDSAPTLDDLADRLTHALAIQPPGRPRPAALSAEAHIDDGQAPAAPVVIAAPPEPLVLTAVPSMLGERPSHRRTRRGKQRPRIAPGQARLFTRD
ncbi:MAG: hypothetical protein R3B06_09700 [Kofleriaceae bacterium]